MMPEGFTSFSKVVWLSNMPMGKSWRKCEVGDGHRDREHARIGVDA
jgi:hypothetical protein